MTADERARPRTKAFSAGGLRGSLGEPHVTGVAEVVVGTEVYELFAVEDDCRPLPSGPDPPGPQEIAGGEGREIVLDPAQWLGQRGGGVEGPAKKIFAAAAAPGFGVLIGVFIFSETSEVAAKLLCTMLGEHIADFAETNREALCMERLLEHS